MILFVICNTLPIGLETSSLRSGHTEVFFKSQFSFTHMKGRRVFFPCFYNHFFNTCFYLSQRSRQRCTISAWKRNCLVSLWHMRTGSCHWSCNMYLVVFFPIKLMWRIDIIWGCFVRKHTQATYYYAKILAHLI